MAYTFSFDSAPPIGFSINAQTGLITIAATASPFVGNLSVRVSDGISTDIKSIPVNLVAPIITPLISTTSRSIYSCGGQMGGGAVAVTPVLYQGGGEMQAAILEIGKNITIYDTGKGQWISRIEDAQPVGVVEVRINQGSGGTYEIGETIQLTASVEIDYNSSGVNQSVTWSIVPSTYSNYGSASSSGLVTVLNGTFYEGDAIFQVKATSIAYPGSSDIFEIYAISKFTSVTLTPSKTTVADGETFTIAARLNGLGPGTEVDAPNLQYVNVVVNEGGNYSYLSGATVNYTAGTGTQDIIITATYYYYVAGYTVSTVAPISIQKQTTPPSGLTLVPSYTVTSTGGTSWDSLSWATLNDDNHLTGAAVGDGTGQPTIVVNLGSALTIKKIMLAGGDLDNTFSPEIAPYLNGGFLEYSNNAGSTWTTYATVSGVVDTAGNSKEYLPEITSQYWRLRRSQYVATTAFKFFT